MKPEEEWARRIIAAHLSVPVEHHDDNSTDGMYDLRVGPSTAPDYAIEVVGAVDHVWTETWNVGPGRSGRMAWPIRGDWMVQIRPGARVKALKRELPALLAEIERCDPPDNDREVLSRIGDELRAAVEALGVSYLSRIRPNGAGLVYLTMPVIGGFVDEHGTAVAPWVTRFLTEPGRSDVLHKLAAIPEASRREVFIGITIAGAPWSVTGYLSDSIDNLPDVGVDLPAVVDGVWLAPTTSTHDSVGIRWDGSKWTRFRLRGNGIDG